MILGEVYMNIVAVDKKVYLQSHDADGFVSKIVCPFPSKSFKSYVPMRS